MRRRKFRLGLLALLGPLLAGAGCCCNRGYILHGSWTLECNRCPNRSASCQSPCDGSAGGCNSAGMGAAEMSAGPPPNATAARGPGRFHPVPTRPVFGPRPEQLVGPVPMQLDQGPLVAPDPEDLPVPQASSTSMRSRPSSRRVSATAPRSPEEGDPAPRFLTYR